MKGWGFMNTMVPNLNPHNIMLLMNEVTPTHPDEQIVFLCKKGDIQCAPLEIILAQYKFCLIHNNPQKDIFKEALKEICPKSIAEMEGLYANIK